MTTESKYLNTAQAAEYCGYAVATMEKLRCIGGGPKFIRRVGGRKVLYRLEDLRHLERLERTWLILRLPHVASCPQPRRG